MSCWLTEAFSARSSIMKTGRTWLPQATSISGVQPVRRPIVFSNGARRWEAVLEQTKDSAHRNRLQRPPPPCCSTGTARIPRPRPWTQNAAGSTPVRHACPPSRPSPAASGPADKTPPHPGVTHTRGSCPRPLDSDGGGGRGPCCGRRPHTHRAAWSAPGPASGTSGSRCQAGRRMLRRSGGRSTAYSGSSRCAPFPCRRHTASLATLLTAGAARSTPPSAGSPRVAARRCSLATWPWSVISCVSQA